MKCLSCMMILAIGCVQDKRMIPLELSHCHSPRELDWMVAKLELFRGMCGDYIPWTAKATPLQLEFTCLNPDRMVPYVLVPPRKIPGSKMVVASAGKQLPLGVPSGLAGTQIPD